MFPLLLAVLFVVDKSVVVVIVESVVIVIESNVCSWMFLAWFM